MTTTNIKQCPYEITLEHNRTNAMLKHNLKEKEAQLATAKGFALTRTKWAIKCLKTEIAKRGL